MNGAVRLLRKGPLYSVRTSVRHGGGYLKKNIYVEENAGLRENGYKTWSLNADNSLRLFFMLLFPGTLFYMGCVSEMKTRDQQKGIKREYGLLPPGLVKYFTES